MHDTDIDGFKMQAGPWIIDEDVCDGDEDDEIADWDSEDDDIIDLSNNDEDPRVGSYAEFLAFHPYKEVLFLSDSESDVVAYHLNGTKVQYLGGLDINGDDCGHDESFVYTPCLI
jgi:hypothetical protein